MKRWVIGAVVGAVVIAGVVSITRPHAVSGPVLVYRIGTPPAPKKNEDHAMSLALASLSTVERDQVIAAMEYAAVRLEASVMPGAEDLGDGDPMDELKKALTHYAPVLTAARALEQGSEGPWTTRELGARALASCPKTLAPDEHCIPIWSGKKDEGLDARARFAAWPITAAMVVELPNLEARGACAENLRGRRSRDGSKIALVLSSEDLALKPVPERDAVRKTARRLGGAMAITKHEDNQRLEALGHATPTGRVAPWLELKPSALLVVPKLSSLVDRDAFAAEIADTCRDARLTAR